MSDLEAARLRRSERAAEESTERLKGRMSAIVAFVAELHGGAGVDVTEIILDLVMTTVSVGDITGLPRERLIHAFAGIAGELPKLPSAKEFGATHG